MHVPKKLSGNIESHLNEIYVDRIADMRIRDMNTVLAAVRQQVIQDHAPGENDLYVRTLELRKGNQASHAISARGGVDNRIAMTPEMMLDFISISTDSLAAQNDDLTMNLIVTDVGEHFFLKRSAGVVLLYNGETKADAECTVNCSKLQLLGMMFGKKEAIASLAVEGDASCVERLLKYMTPFTQTFNIVET